VYYYAIDGDDIGRRLESLVLSEDTAAVRAFSRVVEAAIGRIREHLLAHGCSIILCAGDSILAEAPCILPPSATPTSLDGLSFSIGAGRSPGEALLALKRAKGLGRGRLEWLQRS